MTLIQLFTNIANAIRAKTGSSETIKAENFPTEIADITTGTDTSDANAEPINIRKDKTAYVNGEKITGTLPVLTYPVNPDNPSDFDYQFIEASTAKKVTRASADYIMGAYQIAGNNEPDSWMFEGNRKMKLGIAQSKVATAISLKGEQIKKGEKILGVTGTYEGEGKSFPPDWTEIGYEDTPQGIIDGFNYAKEIYDNWDSSITSLSSKFMNDKKLMTFPLVDTSNVTNMNQSFAYSSLLSIPLIDTSNVTDFNYAFRDCVFEEIPLLDFSSGGSFTGMFVNCYNLVEIPRFIFATTQRYKMNTMFSSCTSLKNVPLLDIKNVMNISYMFNNCPLLTEKSLNNIMGMCISATKITSNKTLKYIGLSQAQATTCQGLSNWDAFVAAGWTTGY